MKYYVITYILCVFYLIDVDVEKLCSTHIEEVDLKENPLSSATWQKLEKVTAIKITMDPPKDNLDEMD